MARTLKRGAGRLSPANVNSQQADQEHIWNRFVDLQLEIDKHDANIAQIEQEMKSLIAQAKRVLPRKKRRSGRASFDIRRGWLGAFYFFLGHCAAKRRAFATAEVLLRKGLTLAPYNAHHYEELTAFLLRRKRTKDAAIVMRRTPLKVMRSEDESTALKYLNWALSHHALFRRIPLLTLAKWLSLLDWAGHKRQLVFQITSSRNPHGR